MVGQSDKVIHELASLTSDLGALGLSSSQTGEGRAQSLNEVPGLLVTVVFLSLGAAFWYRRWRAAPAFVRNWQSRQD